MPSFDLPRNRPTAFEGLLARAAGVNVLGLAARSLEPLFLILISRLYGPRIVGVYLQAYTLVRLLSTLCLSGFQDGVLLYASKHVDRADEHDVMYSAMAACLFWVSCISGIAVGAIYLVGLPWIDVLFQEQKGLSSAVGVMSLSLPFVAVPQLVVAATRSIMIMRFDAILLGALRPGLVLICALAAYFLEPTLMALAWAFLAGNVILSLVSILVFVRFFDASRVFAQLFRFHFHGDLLRFVLPQGLNVTLGQFISTIGVLMLGGLGVRSEMVAFYGTGAEIIRNIRQVRLAFSSAFSPLIARLYSQGSRWALEVQYVTITRWIAVIVFPFTLVLLSFKEEILLLFHESYKDSSAFMFVLALGAVSGCLFGLANNIVAMTGHSDWNLLNSVVAAATSVILAWLWIPRFGLMGAAWGTTCGTWASLALNLAQTHGLLKVRLRIRSLYYPLMAGASACAVFASVRLAWSEDGLLRSVAASALTLVVFGVVLAQGKMDKRDRALLGRAFRRVRVRC